MAAESGHHDEHAPLPPAADVVRGVVAMTASVGGGLVLFLVGLAFLGAATPSWTRRPDEPDRRRSLGIAIDVLVGSVALVDAAASVVDVPARPVLWVAGSTVLLVALVLLSRRRPTPRRSATPQRCAPGR